jgi:hypothetical protein
MRFVVQRVRIPSDQSQPGRSVVSLATQIVRHAAMRRRANGWAMEVGSENTPFRMPRDRYRRERSLHAKAAASLSATARESDASGGVVAHGTFEEDDPRTWETLASPEQR